MGVERGQNSRMLWFEEKEGERFWLVKEMSGVGCFGVHFVGEGCSG